MDIWEQRLKDRLQQLPKLAPPSLESSIRSRIQLEKQLKKRQKRLQWAASLTACLCVAAAALFTVPAWISGRGSHMQSSPAAPAKTGKPAAGFSANKQMAAVQVDWPYSELQAVETTVEPVGQDPARPVSAVNPIATVRVKAKLKNTSSSEPVSNLNAQGVLLFFKEGVQVASYFVDAPLEELQPGQVQSNWTYDPSPESWPQGMDGVQARLLFFKRTHWNITAPPNPNQWTLQPTTEIHAAGWRIGATPLVITKPELSGTGPNQMYMTLTADLYNPTKVTLKQDQLMGFIFLLKSPADPPLDESAAKFMVDIHLAGGEIQPLTHQTVKFEFIGNPAVNLTHRTPVVDIVAKAAPSKP